MIVPRVYVNWEGAQIYSSFNDRASNWHFHTDETEMRWIHAAKSDPLRVDNMLSTRDSGTKQRDELDEDICHIPEHRATL